MTVSDRRKSFWAITLFTYLLLPHILNTFFSYEFYNQMFFSCTLDNITITITSMKWQVESTKFYVSMCATATNKYRFANNIQQTTKH